MHKIFLPLYRYFSSHKPLMYIVLAVTSFLFLFFGLKLTYEEDISKLLPSSSVESQLAFSSIELKDKIYLQVTSADEPLSPESLCERMDEFIALLFEKDSTSHLISNVLYKMEPELALNGLDFILEHLPSFVDTLAYPAFESALQPEAVENQMWVNYEQMMEDEMGDITQAIAYDPLNLRKAVIGDAMAGAIGNFNIIDGHFFCPDSTVALAYLAPSFRSLNSQAATAFSKMLSDTQKEFDASHPDVKVHAHGDPIGSVSNAGRIKSDLVVTVGISIVLILILIGLCFRSFPFIWKLLLPILYGTAFSLACIYWIKGGMSLMALGLGAVVLGVAISYCLHVLIHHFFVGDPEKLLLDESTPVFLGCITTVGAFCSLLFTDSDLLRDFGLFASFALLGSTLFALIFLPHFLPKRKANADSKTFRRISRLNNLPFDKKPWFLAMIVIIVIIGIIFSPKVKFDSDLRNLDYNSPDEVIAESLFNEKNNDGFYHLYFATVSTDIDEALEADKSLMVKLDSLKKQGVVHSYTDLIPKLFVTMEDQERRIAAWNAYWTEERKNEAIRLVDKGAQDFGLDPMMFYDFKELLNADYEAASLLESGVVPENLLGNFIECNADNQFMVFTDVSMDFDEKDIVTDALVLNPKTFVLEPFYYCKSMVEVINDDFNIAVWISSLFVLLILLVSFRNLITALLSFLPMVLSWFMVQGYMAIIGLEFNLINIIISTFIFGVGVDYSIFITEGLLIQARTGNRDILTWHKIAIFFSAVILVIVVSSLLFAVHPAIRSIGLSTLIGMASTIMISYALQPFAFWQLMKWPWYKRSVIKKAQKEAEV
ncbi:MAG: MMPL family transporter [Bacteroidales bacterium]|nr:MMPL family transporter [Bacteroidales bacterium]